MTAFSEDLKIHVDAFCIEAQMLLRFQLAFNRLAKLNFINSISRSELVDILIALKTIENDLVIRVCKFDDKRKDTHNFSVALRLVKDSHPYKSELRKKIRDFQFHINELKTKRRHEQLAHLKKGKKDDDFEPRYNLKPAIKMILEIIDLMAIQKQNYYWKDGSFEKYNLKEVVFSE